MVSTVRGKRRTTARKATPRKTAPQKSAVEAFNEPFPEEDIPVDTFSGFAASAYDPPAVAERDATPSETFAPEFAPSAGQSPVPFEPFEPEPEGDEFPHYYHAWLPNLTIRKGRPEQIKFRGSIYRPRNAQQEANVRAALKKYVPGGNPDRWRGDNNFDEYGNPRELRCTECGMFTANYNVMDDHNQKTKHHVRIP